MKAARAALFEGQLDLNPDALVFLVETAANAALGPIEALKAIRTFVGVLEEGSHGLVVKGTLS